MLSAHWPRQSTRSRRLQRGFTLVELLGAMTGALFLTAAVYMWTRDVTTFFQRQMRLSEATMSSVTGFERLRADIARAGFLSSPNLARDPLRCPRPASGEAQEPTQVGTQLNTYEGITQMALLRIVTGVAPNPGGNYILANNAGGYTPHQIILWGNYSGVEEFPVKNVNANRISLKMNSGALARLGVTGGTAADIAIVSRVFRAGRIVRVVDGTGRHQYSVLDDPPVVTDSANELALQLLTGVQLLQKSTAGAQCGLRGGATDLTVNPIDVIRYRLSDLRLDYATEFAQLLDTATLALPAYDNTRLDLVREEMQIQNTNFAIDPPVIAGTTELIAEYAIDLKFGLTVNNDVTSGSNTYLDEADGSLMNYADMTYNTATAGQTGAFGPHLIRGVRARLSVRSVRAEYDSPIVTSPSNTGQMYRVQVDPGQYARVRTLSAHIATRNTRAETWN